MNTSNRSIRSLIRWLNIRLDGLPRSRRRRRYLPFPDLDADPFTVRFSLDKIMLARVQSRIQDQRKRLRMARHPPA
jgi:hypothetical protein